MSSSGLQQVVLNIIKNAAQAFKDCDTSGFAPCITISTSQDDDNITIEIKDNGPGIDKDIIQHVFEPFFSTRPVGSGTGLGLSVAYYIMTNSYGGSLIAESVPGNGAVFIVKLPVEQKV